MGMVVCVCSSWHMRIISLRPSWTISRIARPLFKKKTTTEKGIYRYLRRRCFPSFTPKSCLCPHSHSIPGVPSESLLPFPSNIPGIAELEWRGRVWNQRQNRTCWLGAPKEMEKGVHKYIWEGRQSGNLKIGPHSDLSACECALLKHPSGQAPVAHTCNTSYSGSRDQEDHSSKPALANSSQDSIVAGGLRQRLRRHQRFQEAGLLSKQAATQQTQVQSLSPENKGRFPYIPFRAGYRNGEGEGCSFLHT
jgi:hypothetical protein